jgi:nitrate/nitrite transporter NarK
MLGSMSWRHAFAIFGSVGLFWAAGWWWWFRDDPRDHSRVSATELEVIVGGGAEERPHERIQWRWLTESRSLGVLCAMYFCAIYGWYFYLTWLPTYLLRARGFDLRQAGWLAALPLLSIALGVSLGGWLSDRLTARLGARRGRRICGLVGFPLAALAILGGIGTSNSMTSALLLAFAGGAAALGVAPAWPVALEIGGMHAGVVSGAMNMCGNLGGTLSSLVIGFSLERWGSWEAPLVSVAVLYLAAALCWLAIDPADRIAQT